LLVLNSSFFPSAFFPLLVSSFLIYRYVRLSAFLDALIQRVDDRLRMDAALDASSSDTGGEAVGGAVAGGKAREEAGMGMGGSGGEGAGAGAEGEGDKEGDGEGDGDRGGARGIEGMVVGAQRRWQREDRVYHGRVIDCQREVREALAQDCDTPKVMRRRERRREGGKEGQRERRREGRREEGGRKGKMQRGKNEGGGKVD
jgi:hypothetical protein